MKRIDDLLGLRVFEKVVTLGSLTAAAQALGISLAAASKRLSKLEQYLGVQLIHRSTRRLSVSDEGQTLFDYAQRIVSELEQAEEAILQKSEQISGTLTITSPNSFGRRHLVKLIAEFRQLHPNIIIQLLLSDSIEEMISEGIDVAIRYGELPDSRLVARRLLNNDRILCASPDYLAQNGTPQTLDELYQHHCIIISRHTEINWAFPTQTLHIQQAISCNDGEAAHAMALNGMGIVLKSYWDVAEDLSTGKLVQVLPEQAVISAPINIITLKNQHQPARIRLFIDFLLNSLQPLQMHKDKF